ncbi:MAG: cyclic pyranopterin phosphate synthase, partial [Candidatus Omnitrophota bacterium]
MIIDQHNRPIHYLRVSLTDMCNLRCVYCMPEDMNFRPSPELLQDDEIIELVDLFAELGFNKIRFTGGEPTLRQNLVELVRKISRKPGIETVAMTTNGILMDYLSRPLHEAGLQRVNVSVDTLNPEKFRKLTRWGNLRDVMKGIDAAEKAGLHVKLNCVVVRGVNDVEDVVELARLSLERPWQIRFIEMMPFGRISEFQQNNSVKEAELRQTISTALGPLETQNEGLLDGEASVYKLPGAAGSLGFISPITNPFCAGCNRVRLTADGMLRLCLLKDDELDLKGPLRAGMKRDALKTLISDKIRCKPWGHDLSLKQ